MMTWFAFEAYKLAEYSDREFVLGVYNVYRFKFVIVRGYGTEQIRCDGCNEHWREILVHMNIILRGRR